MKKLFSVISLLFASLCASAQSKPADTVAQQTVYRPSTSAVTIGFPGYSRITNTYLSPLRYTGWSVAVNTSRLRAMKFNPQHWIMEMEENLQIDRGENPAHNNAIWRIDLYLKWDMMRRWQLPHGITVAVGPGTSIDTGVIYNPRNGNNPVAVEAAWTIDASALAAWNFKIKRLPITLLYQTSFPIVGAFFSPDYGELYYEISLGNHKGLCHAAHWGNYNAWRNLIAADLHFGTTALRIGFRSNWVATKTNNITNDISTGSFVIGLAGEWMRINPYRGLSDQAKIIHALY